jgi:hypothetical protein
VLRCWGLPVGHLMNHGSIRSVARQMQQDGFCTDPPEYIQGYAELMAAVGGRGSCIGNFAYTPICAPSRAA